MRLNTRQGLENESIEDGFLPSGKSGGRYSICIVLLKERFIDAALSGRAVWGTRKCCPMLSSGELQTC
ncbi:hypothetical protein BOSE62_40645 [Bosea sp. 62]|uniref:hypothetical protein n=1 Tax=unclassified Bosea (in: a-proteobacteria) TaxID=2653178 RepID=UPI00125A69C9|nr:MULTISPECIES: hypothetical protein [unclassified Bosea (in: a-proteobacteria)]CAD5255691.1 hypothetical protein BOSE46_120136 [Bosea sp. 46]CAD5259632.1 hypothetical protein BOSE21B_110351 [Bosea sp. 21B]CAD5281077.1 hypothetical protein BOSE7B_40864 [Bosea sp. 7B]VVT58073.1 hypothetical protein BOS5A_200403 [Bosea sp. EC-HK365B]VXB46215.1 hypothetical protein BOSE29B_110302 [Bosea sp. 29B]